MGKTKVNWIIAQQEYLVSKEMSLSDIAKKYYVSLSRVKKVSMKQKWFDTRERIWENAREMAIKETVGSATEMIKRHSETARYFQETGLKLLKKCLKTITPDKIRLTTMLRMLVLGLKIERDLYSEAIKRYFTKPTNNKLNRYDEISQELKEAAFEALKEREFNI